MVVAIFLAFFIFIQPIQCKEKFEQAVMKEVNARLKKVQTSNLSLFSLDLLKKESEINERKRLLGQKEQQLQMTEQGFIARVKKFEERQQNFLGCLDRNEQKRGERIGRLVEIIAGMKSDKAAELLSVQESDLAVQILGSLDPNKASKIFNLMKREISARLQKQYLIMQQ